MYALKCEFEGGFSGDTGTHLVSSVVNADRNPSGIFVYYKISSPDIRVRLVYESRANSAVLRRHMLPFDAQIFYDDGIDFRDQYSIVLNAFRDQTSSGNSDASVIIYNVKLLYVTSEGISLHEVLYATKPNYNIFRFELCVSENMATKIGSVGI